MPKDIREVVVSGSIVTVKHDDKAIETGADLSDLQSLREVLDIRARAFHMLGVMAYTRYPGALPTSTSRGFAKFHRKV